MKVILYIATTINGMIAKKDGNSDFVSSEDEASFNKICRNTGCVIMGRNTLEYFKSLPIESWPNTDGIHIALTSSKSLSVSHPQIYFTDSPQSALKLAEQKNKSGIVVIGGSKTWGSFMKENLVDEIYLDIEPLAFGEGMPMFIGGDFEIKLELIESKPLSPQTIQLHYRVKK